MAKRQPTRRVVKPVLTIRTGRGDRRGFFELPQKEREAIGRDIDALLAASRAYGHDKMLEAITSVPALGETTLGDLADRLQRLAADARSARVTQAERGRRSGEARAAESDELLKAVERRKLENRRLGDKMAIRACLIDQGHTVDDSELDRLRRRVVAARRRKKHKKSVR